MQMENNAATYSTLPARSSGPFTIPPACTWHPSKHIAFLANPTLSSASQKQKPKANSRVRNASAKSVYLFGNRTIIAHCDTGTPQGNLFLFQGYDQIRFDGDEAGCYKIGYAFACSNTGFGGYFGNCGGGYPPFPKNSPAGGPRLHCSWFYHRPLHSSVPPNH